MANYKTLALVENGSFVYAYDDLGILENIKQNILLQIGEANFAVQNGVDYVNFSTFGYPIYQYVLKILATYYDFFDLVSINEFNNNNTATYFLEIRLASRNTRAQYFISFKPATRSITVHV